MSSNGLLLYRSEGPNVPPSLQDGEMRVRGDAQGERVGVPSNFREISGVRGVVEVYIYIIQVDIHCSLFNNESIKILNRQVKFESLIHPHHSF